MQAAPGPVISIHIGTPGLREALRLRRTEPDPVELPGLRYGRTGMIAEFGPGPGPSRPHPTWVGMFAVWESDADVERFVTEVPAASRFDWHVRLEPLRVAGAWPGLDDVRPSPTALGPDDPVSAVTLAEPRLARFLPFLAASGPAERAAAVAAVRPPVSIVRVPRFAMSYSQWTSVRAMTAYAHPRGGGPHGDAMAKRERSPFHHAEAFVRCRTYHEQGAQPSTA